MADTSLRITADTTQAERSLAKLSSAFTGLKSQLLGLGLGAAIQQVNAFALELSNAAKASEVSISTVSSFSKAVSGLGGDAGKAAGDVIDFVAGLDAAKKGSASAQIDLAKVGITLSDLGKLSNEDLFKKTVQGIAAIGDSSERNRMAVQLLGRSFKDIDIRDVARAMSSVTMDTGAIESAAAAQKNLNIQLSKVQEALLKVIKPLNDMVSKINISVDSVETFMKSAILLTAVIAGLYASVKLFAAEAALAIFFVEASKAATIFSTVGLAGAMAATKFFIADLLRLSGALAAIQIGLLGAASGMVTTITLFERFYLIMSGIVALIARFAIVAGIILAINEAMKIGFNVDPIDAMAKKLEDLVRSKFPALAAMIDKVAAKLGISNSTDPRVGQRGRGDPEEIANREKYAADQAKLAADARQKIIDAQRGQRLEQDKILRGYEQENNMSARSLILQKDLIGLTEDQANRESKLNDVTNAYLNKKNDLQTRYNDLQAAAAVGTAEEKAAFAAFAASFESTMGGLFRLYQDQIKYINTIVNQEEVAKAKEKDRLNVIEQITKQYDRQVSLGETLRGINDKMVDVKFEDSLKGLTPLQKQIAQIRENNRKGALEAGRSFASQFEGMDLTTEQSAELAKGLDAIRDRYKLISDAQESNLGLSRTWGAGWKDAFNDYVDNATNAAMIAQDIFRSMTKNVEDSLVDMAKTGKFQWKNMLANMAEDLLRSQIRQLLASLMGGKSSGGSVIMGAIAGVGKLLGFANGGVIPTNGPVIVGERGPEILTGAAGRNVIPNDQLGGSTVVYNINAVDALSFKQMVARDPAFIHAVATQGGKSIPGTRR